VTRLVVTADDVGIHPAMTAGALRAHDEGIVTACSVAATGAAFLEAASALRERPSLDIGCHLVFVDGSPLSPPAQVRSLVDGGGRFLDSYRQLAWRAARGKVDPQEVYREAGLQVARLADTGLIPRHLNSHQHLHLLPALFGAVARVASEFRIPWLRLPREPRPGWLGLRGPQLRALNWLAKRAARRLPASGPRSVDFTLGLHCAGRLNEAKLREALAAARGTCELVAHPGSSQQELGRAFPWGYQWEEETWALTRPGLRQEIGDRGIELVGFRDLRG